MKNKKQHYVSKLYMKNFTNDNIFNVLNLKTGQVILNVPYESQCYCNYYYGKDNYWEKILGKYESSWNVLFKKIIAEERFCLNKKENELIKQFAVIQSSRVPNSEKVLKMTYWEILKEALTMEMKANNISINDSIMSGAKKYLYDNYLQVPAKENLDLSHDFTIEIEDLSVCIIEYDCKNDLISSDNPVIKYNGFTRFNIGWGMAGFSCFFPINSKKIAVIYDEKMYPELKNNHYYVSRNENEVHAINEFIMISSGSIVFFQNEKNKKNVEKYYKNNIENRKKYIESMQPKIFGQENDKYICFSEPQIPIDYNFRFVKLIQRAKRFQMPELEAFPRIKTNEYIQRMKMRKIISNNSVTRKMYKINNKKLNQFNHFVNDYWGNFL